MFTQQTISGLSSLQDLTYKSKDLVYWTTAPHCTQSRDPLLTEATRNNLKQAAAAQQVFCKAALLEGLLKAKPEFDGTPFAQTISDIIVGYEAGCPRAELSASVALSSLHRQASDWLKAQAEAVLPLLKFTVSSAFGTLTVEATSSQKARLVAAAQHFKCKVGDLAGDELRGFANGVLVA